MGTMIEQMNLALDTKTKIREAIIDKGMEVKEEDTFASYPDKIKEIGDWKPQPDWYDIEKILFLKNIISFCI